MTKYIVSGYIGFDNFGDEAIARVLSSKLKSEGAEKITLISSNPLKTSELHGVNSCGMLKFFKPLIEADTLISGGGSLLQDSTSLKSLIYYLGIIYCALLLRKKVQIFAQGIGPINSKIGQILTKCALKHADKISVRDKKSQELLLSWGIESELVKDPVFDLDIHKKELKGTVGIQLRNYKTLSNEFLETLAGEIYKNFSDKQIKILSLQDSIDLTVCKTFKKILEQNGMTNIEIVSNANIDKIFDEISKLEYLIAMRFHANVVGIKAGVKTLAINYDPKVAKLAEEYNIPSVELNQKVLTDEFKKLTVA